MAAAPARCPDCPGPEPGAGGGVPSVPHLGIAVDEGDVLPGALRIVRQLRPAWEPATVKTKVWGGPCAGPPRNGGREQAGIGSGLIPGGCGARLGWG